MLNTKFEPTWWYDFDSSMIITVLTREAVAKGVFRNIDLHIYDPPSPSSSPSSSYTALGFLFIANPCNNLSTVCREV